VNAVYSASTNIPIVLFISQAHTGDILNATYYTDGWTVRGRDIGNGAATFTPINTLVWDDYNATAPFNNGLWDHASFVAGNFLHLQLTTQTAASSDYAFQFYWGDHALGPNGVAWLSCADVRIGLQSSASSTTASMASAMFAVIGAFLLRKFTQ